MNNDLTRSQDSDFAIISSYYFPNQNLETLFNSTINWIKKEDARIIKQNDTIFLEVSHRGDWRTRGFIRKTIFFLFTSRPTSVTIEVRIRKLPRSESQYTKVIYLHWKEIIESYFAYLGVIIDAEFINGLYQKDELKSEQSRLVIGLIISLCFILSQVWLTVLYHNYFTPISGLAVFFLFSLHIWSRYIAFKNRMKLVI